MAGSPLEYVARDLLTWEALDPLPYQGVSFGRTLDQHGPWQGSLPVASPKVQQFAWREATRPSRTALFVDLNGTLVWGGLVWTRDYESDDKTHTVKVGAQDFGSLFLRRVQAEDYSTLWESGEDPMKIARRILEDAIAKEAEAGQPGHVTGSAIPVTLNPPTGSVNPLTGEPAKVIVSYPGTSLQGVDSILNTLSQMGFGAGFDYSWDSSYLPGTKTPAVECNLWYPLKGRTARESGIVILGRDTLKWRYSEDGSTQALEVIETGSGTGGLEPVIVQAHVAGYPLLQKATARTQITTEQLLAQIALGDLALVSYPPVSLSITLPLTLPGTPAAERGTLALGEFDVGDRFIFRVDPVSTGSLNTDPRFPEGMAYEFRINSWLATPKDVGQSTLTLECGMPPLGYVPPPAPPM